MGRAWLAFVLGWLRLGSVGEGGFGLPLNESVSFKAVLQVGGRVQVPRLFRWQYRMESSQVLRVDVRVLDFYVVEEFLARMTRDGRITVPRLTLQLLREGRDESLVGKVLEVTVGPVKNLSGKVEEK